LTLTDNTVREQLDASSVLLRTLLLVMAIVLAASLAMLGIRQLQAADPYIQDVLVLSGDQSRGQAIFQMNCAVCHGIEADGEVGPSLLQVSDHMSKVNLIKQVVSGKTPPMPQFQPDPQEMADLLSYLETL
jgi:mono/diheme cytochrome c family protein